MFLPPKTMNYFFFSDFFFGKISKRNDKNYAENGKVWKKMKNCWKMQEKKLSKKKVRI